MSNPSRWSFAAMTALTAGLAAGAFIPLFTLTPIPVSAAPDTVAFPDIQDHWARPFIQQLAERDIVAGYLDGTYRPEGAVSRDEFAAIIRQAFNQAKERSIPSGSVYNDVPADYWAAPAIEEAYEMGFMSGYPEGDFRPLQPVSRVEALVALSRNLNLADPTNIAEEAAAEPTTTAAAAAQPAAQPARRRQLARRPLAFPLAFTALMQPILGAPARAAATLVTPPAADPATGEASAAGVAEPAATEPAATEAPADGQLTSAEYVTGLSNYYTDADTIPEYALRPVAEATEAGIVVNYPEPTLLNPNRPASRGEIAAVIYQTLVEQGRAEPLPEELPAKNYIVNDR